MDRFQTQQHDVSDYQPWSVWRFKLVQGMMLCALAIMLPLTAIAESDSKSGSSGSTSPSSNSAPSSKSSDAKSSKGNTRYGGPQVQPHQAIQKVQPIQNRASIQPRQ